MLKVKPPVACIVIGGFLMQVSLYSIEIERTMIALWIDV